MNAEELKNGVVLAVDKPRQWSSFQVVNKLKWHIRREFGLKSVKIGHAGTLDPLASGLLLVCVGKATKQIEQLQQGDKTYTGTMVLGATTPCFDLERPVDFRYPFAHLSLSLIEEVVRNHFLGIVSQIPPQFSAVKVNGSRAYVSARDGQVADIEPKLVHIYDFQITDFRMGNKALSPSEKVAVEGAEIEGKELYRNPLGEIPAELPQLDFCIRCGKGTYIRSIARDLGDFLNCGAFLSALRREQIGDFSICQALSPDDICLEKLQNLTSEVPVLEE